MLVYEGGKVSESAYWSLRYNDKLTGWTEGKYREEFMTLFQESVGQRLISDVPLGAFLSGGVDSSSVVAAVSPLMRHAGKTLFFTFQEGAFNKLPSHPPPFT